MKSLKFNTLVISIFLIAIISGFSIEDKEPRLPGNTFQQNSSVTTYWNFELFNSGNFLPPCTTPSAVCCSGEWKSFFSTQSGFGNAIANIDSLNRLHFVFLQQTALPDSTIPIPLNFFVGSEASNSLGYDSIIVMQGVYSVNFSNHPQYGEVSFNTRLVGSATPNLIITVIPEGFLYAASINTTRSNIRDKSTISLRSSTGPFQIVDIDTVEIDSITLTGNCYFNNAPTGNYYIVVNHRNSLETWSANPVSITGNTTSYNFTTASSKAFGNNMSLKFDKWCTFSGDVNQDGSIELSDVLQIYNDASIFTSGYVVTDLNGDSITDLSDVLLTFNNSASFVQVHRP